MKYFIVIIMSLVLLSACSIGPPAAAADYIDLSPFQLDDIRELIEGFNGASIESGSRYYIWYTLDALTAEEIAQRNDVFSRAGLLPICLIIQADNYIAVVTDVTEALRITNNLNEIKTNLYSRVMFFIDDTAVALLGGRVSVYDVDLDIFARD